MVLELLVSWGFLVVVPCGLGLLLAQYGHEHHMGLVGLENWSRYCTNCQQERTEYLP